MRAKNLLLSWTVLNNLKSIFVIYAEAKVIFVVYWYVLSIHPGQQRVHRDIQKVAHEVASDYAAADGVEEPPTGR